MNFQIPIAQQYLKHCRRIKTVQWVTVLESCLVGKDYESGSFEASVASVSVLVFVAI